MQEGSEFQHWIFSRNGISGTEDAKIKIGQFSKILDAGCGNGRVTALLSTLAPNSQVIGIDLIDIDTPSKNCANLKNISFKKSNLRNSLKSLGKFDLIYCQEVLHHTGDSQESFNNLVDILSPGGVIAIYVYRKKAFAREFMDDHVRAEISKLSYDDALTVCNQITDLGRALSHITEEVDVDDIPVLGIEKGRYTPQRLLYNFFLKCYWNSELGYSGSSAVNYDWYHPQNCSRHTIDEVIGWFESRGLKITWQYTDPYGITVHGKK